MKILIILCSLSFFALDSVESGKVDNVDVTIENDVQTGLRFIRNRWKPEQFVNIEKGPVSCGGIQPGWWSAHWTIEDAGGGFVRIKNRWKNTYLHNQNGRLEAGAIQPGWWSAQWTIEKVDKFVRIKNRWTSDYLHNQNGPLQLGKIDQGWWSAQWKLKKVEGGEAPAQTADKKQPLTKEQQMQKDVQKALDDIGDALKKKKKK